MVRGNITPRICGDRAWMTASGLNDEVLADRGPVIFGLPGGGISPAIYDPLVLRQARMVPVDWMSLSCEADPVSVADALATALQPRRRSDAGATILAGHSIGGVISLLCAIRHPEMVDGLVISNTGPRIEGHGDPGLPGRIRAGLSAGDRQSFLASCFDRLPPEPMQRLLDDYLADIDLARFLAAVVGLRRLDLTPLLPSIRCPVLLAHGRDDRRRPTSAAEALAQGIPDSRIVWLRAGHTPMVDAADDWVCAVDDFVASRIAGPVGALHAEPSTFTHANSR